MKRTTRTIWIVVAVLLLSLLPAIALASASAPVEQETPPATSDWDRIRQAGKLVFGTAADYPPFEFYNSNYELDGFDIALARALGERLGVEVVFNDFAFDGLLNTLPLGQVDAAIGAISVTPERQALVDFTNLYYVGDSAALARTEFTGEVRAATDLAGQRVGVQRGTTFQAWAQENLVDKGVIAQEDLVAYATPAESLRDLRNGAIDVGLMGMLTAELAVERYPELKIVGQQFNQQQFAIAAPKGSDLIAQLNRALLDLQSDGTYAELVNLYLQVLPTGVTPDEEEAIVENPAPEEVVVEPPPCVHGMAWVADLSLDDQNMTAPPVMAPGQDFTKGWRVLNNGTCAWEADFALAYVDGNRIESSMGGSSVAVGRQVQPGETADIYVNLRAPQTYGTFQGFWKMRDNVGQYFGEVVWVGIQVPDPNPPPPPPPPPTAGDPNLRADASYIAPGQCTTIRWDVDNVNSVYFIEGGNEQGVGGHDARTVCPGGTTTYTLRVVWLDGSSHDYSITITVSGAPDYSMNFWADNTNLDAGQCTALRWDVRNVQAVYLDGAGVPGVSARDVCPGNTQTYTLVAVKYDGGQDSRQVTIDVRNAPPPPSPPYVERFSISSNQIRLGECVRLEWRTDNADRVNLTRNGTPIQYDGPGNGDIEDCPGVPGLFEYTLIAFNNAGTSGQTVSVNVSAIQPR
jgi:polar amino acid transport system substrate-binding protein